MNRLCLVCNEAATRVCKHPECGQNPYFCNGPCTNGASEIVHTHNSVMDFISIDDLDKRIQQVKSMVDPLVVHFQHFELLEKKVRITKDNFNKMIDDMVEEHRNDMKKIVVHLKPELEETIDKIQVRGYQSLNGGSIGGFFNDKILQDAQQQKNELLTKFRRSIFSELEEVGRIKCDYFSFEKIVQACKKLFSQGIVLIEKKNYQQALNTFTEGRKLCSYSHSIHFQIGNCLRRFLKYQEAQHHFKRALKLEPNYLQALNSIGCTYFQREKYEQAIQWYDRGIFKNPNEAKTFVLRAESYFMLRKYQQASVDLDKAKSLNSDDQEVKKRIKNASMNIFMKWKKPKKS